jgi:RNA polymerase sigma-70 factor (ECF subfamily)
MPSSLELARLYDDHAQALFGFLLNLTRNEADTRDVLQEVFVKLARQPERLNGVRDERAFLLRLAHNAAIDRLRRRATRERNYEQLAAEFASAFAPAHDPDEQGFRLALPPTSARSSISSSGKDSPSNPSLKPFAFRRTPRPAATGMA